MIDAQTWALLDLRRRRGSGIRRVCAELSGDAALTQLIFEDGRHVLIPDAPEEASGAGNQAVLSRERSDVESVAVRGWQVP